MPIFPSRPELRPALHVKREILNQDVTGFVVPLWGQGRSALCRVAASGLSSCARHVGDSVHVVPGEGGGDPGSW